MRFWSAAFLLCALTGSASGQIEIPDWENSVSFELVASQTPVRPGDTFMLAVVADIEEGYHLYGPEEMEPSRTELEGAGESIEFGDPEYPPVVRRDLSGLGTYDLYEGQVVFRIPVSLEASASAEARDAKVTVRYQVCTDFACSAPTDDVLTIALEGAEVGAAIEHPHPTLFVER